MTKLFLAIILSLFIFSCTTLNPPKQVCFLAANPYGRMYIPIVIEPGEFDKTDEERGYKIFDSVEELMKYMESLFIPKEGI